MVPVWVSLTALPIHLHDQRALYEIVRAIGRPIKVDVAALNFLRPSVALMCIEVDVTQELPSKIYVDCGDSSLFQPVIYEDLPLYCQQCTTFGWSMCHP